MAYKVIAEGGFIYEYQCETVADVSSLPVSPACSLGSRAKIESSGSVYELAINNTWKLSSESVTLSHSSETIGVASGAALTANANRKYALIVNDSDSVIYLKIGSAAVLNAGIRLNASGGSYEMSAAYGNLDTRVINAISSAADKVLLITEGV